MMRAALLLLSLLGLAACQDMSQYSPEYRAVHEREFWRTLEGGGVDAAAWANLRAHLAAEREVGR